MDASLAALARRRDIVQQLWDRLMMAVVVQPAADQPNMLTVPRYDMTFQLHEVEVRRLWCGGAQYPMS